MSSLIHAATPRDNWRSITRGTLHRPTASRILKLSISTVFLALCSVRETIGMLFSRSRPSSFVVLYYHSISEQHRIRFARQLDSLLRWATLVPADWEGPCQPGQRYISITFDDGLESVLENALPELAERRIPVTLFIVVESLGRLPIWISSDSDLPRPERVITLKQLRSLPSDLVAIGSHSLSHQRLTRLSEGEARKEICDSRERLRDMLRREVSLFSFPYGAFNNTLVHCCRDAGYSRVFTTLPRLAFTKPGGFECGRIAVEPTDWPWELRLKVLGAYRWLPIAFAVKRRLISRLRAASRLQRDATGCKQHASCDAQRN